MQQSATCAQYDSICAIVEASIAVNDEGFDHVLIGKAESSLLFSFEHQLNPSQNKEIKNKGEMKVSNKIWVLSGF